MSSPRCVCQVQNHHQPNGFGGIKQDDTDVKTRITNL